MTLLDLFTKFDEALEWSVEDDLLLADHLPCADEHVEAACAPRTAVG